MLSVRPKLKVRFVKGLAADRPQWADWFYNICEVILPCSHGTPGVAFFTTPLSGGTLPLLWHGCAVKMLLVTALVALGLYYYGPRLASSGLLTPATWFGAEESTEAGPPTEASRLFDLGLDEAQPGGIAIATGGYYDLPYTASIAPNELDHQRQNFKRVGHIMVTGLSPELKKGMTIAVWLEPDGLKKLRGENVAAYRVVKAPTAQLMTGGGWMHQIGRTQLDYPKHK
jgi:hypothetical protein